MRKTLTALLLAAALPTLAIAVHAGLYLQLDLALKMDG